MMTDTESLLRTLVATAEPVARLASPGRRALIWLAVTVPFAAFIVLVVGARADLMDKLSEGRYLIEQAAAFLTAIAAAYGAFSAVVPSSRRWPLFLPLLPLAVWLGSVGQGCLQDWIVSGPTGLALNLDFQCLPAIALVGSVPAVLMAVMIRRGAPLFPHLAVGLGALAAAAIGDVGLRLFHGKDASIMILVWQLSSVALIAGLAGYFGPHLHRWRHAHVVN